MTLGSKITALAQIFHVIPLTGPRPIGEGFPFKMENYPSLDLMCKIS
jgi:hypothetical protein